MRIRTLLALGCIASLVGCGGSDETPTTTAARSPTASEDPSTVLKAAVRQALKENARLSHYVSWHRRVPAWGSDSTRGAALAELRQSAAANRRSGVRARFTRARLDVRSIRLDPSYERATAVVATDDRVRLYERDRRGSPRLVTSRERARIALRRIGSADQPQFVVTRVWLLR